MLEFCCSCWNSPVHVGILPPMLKTPPFFIGFHIRAPNRVGNKYPIATTSIQYQAAQITMPFLQLFDKPKGCLPRNIPQQKISAFNSDFLPVPFFSLLRKQSSEFICNFVEYIPCMICSNLHARSWQWRVNEPPYAGSPNAHRDTGV